MKVTESIGSKLTKFSEAVDEKLENIDKRVNDIDGARPAGHGDDDGDVDTIEEVKKKSEHRLWANLF